MCNKLMTKHFKNWLELLVKTQDSKPNPAAPNRVLT